MLCLVYISCLVLVLVSKDRYDHLSTRHWDKMQVSWAIFWYPNFTSKCRIPSWEVEEMHVGWRQNLNSLIEGWITSYITLKNN
jgi:hypothetical protein